MTGKNTLRARFVSIEVVISEWPPVAIDTYHLLPQHFSTICVFPQTIEFRSLFAGRDTGVKGRPGPNRETASRCTALWLFGTQEILHQVGR